MNEEVKNMNLESENVNEESKKHEEEVKKLMDELKENEVYKSLVSNTSGDGGWIYALLLLMFAFWNPMNKSDSSSLDKQFAQMDKQQIAYLSGKIEAYEKMLRGE